MPAMWDRLRTTAAAPGAGVIPHKLRPSRGRGGAEQHDDDDSDPERAFWQSSFENRLHAVDKTDGPFKYEIRRGKTVALSELQNVDRRNSHSSSNESDCTVTPVDETPQHKPRRLPEQGHKKNKSGVSATLNQHSSAQRAASPSAVDNMYGYNYSYGRPAVEQISPPSSPDWSTAQNGLMHDDVSPIDDDDDDFDLSHHQYLRSAQPTPPSPQPAVSQSEQQSRSSIPMLRRDRRKHQEAAAAALREAKTKEKKDKDKHKQGTRTNSSRNGGARLDQSGDFAVTDASNAGRFDASTQFQPYGVTTTISGPQPSRPGDAIHAFGQRMRQQLGRSKPEPVESRPPWQGLSGRASLLPSVRDNLDVPPLIMPTRGGKPGARNGDASLLKSPSPISPADPETPSSAVATLRRLLPHTTNQKLGQNANNYLPQLRTGTLSYPNSPFTDTQSPYSQFPTQPTSHPSTHPALEHSSPSDQQKTIKRKQPALAPHHLPKLSTSSSNYSEQPEPVDALDPPSFTGTAPNAVEAPEPWQQPQSRFSVTTYATSSAAEDEHSPVPLPASQPTSIMDRRRPNLGPDYSNVTTSADPVVISMKHSHSSSPSPRSASAEPKSTPHPDSALQSPLHSPDMTQSPDLIMSTSKALPPAPPELSAASDRVAHLNARLESLAHRRVNLTRSIKQMTELMPCDTLMASTEVLRKREIEKQKVEILRAELAEVQREEYDLGLKLHLAYKRLDREAEFESTGLWVKRVTG